MRKTITILLTAIIFSLMLATVASAESRVEPNHEISSEAAEQTLLRLLSDPAQEAIKNYYGELRQYWRDQIISVEKVPNSYYYKVVMQVETFYGPHNPPYGLETMTFYISYGEIKLEKFEHQDED